jgi:hypothetical protein
MHSNRTWQAGRAVSSTYLANVGTVDRREFSYPPEISSTLESRIFRQQKGGQRDLWFLSKPPLFPSSPVIMNISQFLRERQLCHLTWHQTSGEDAKMTPSKRNTQRTYLQNYQQSTPKITTNTMTFSNSEDHTSLHKLANISNDDESFLFTDLRSEGCKGGGLPR